MKKKTVRPQENISTFEPLEDRCLLNAAPTAFPMAIHTPVNTPISDKVLGGDPEQQPVTFIADTLPAHGTLNLNAVDGTFTYTPDTGFTGDDFFTCHTNDGELNTETPATISIFVGRVISVAAGKRQAFTDANGEAYTFSLSGRGSGTAELYLLEGNSDLVYLNLKNTTSSNSVSLLPRKPSFTTTIGNVTLENGASLKSFSAKTADLTRAGIFLEEHIVTKTVGSIGTIEVRDLLNGADILMSGSTGTKTKIAAGLLGDGSVIDFGATSTLKSLTLAGWSDGGLSGGSLGTFTVKADARRHVGGTFGAEVYVSSITKMTIDNAVNATFSVGGSVGTVRFGSVSGGLFNFGEDAKGVSVSTFTCTGDFSNTDVTVSGSMTTVSIRSGTLANFAMGANAKDSSNTRFTVVGSLVDATVQGSGSLGTVSLGSASGSEVSAGQNASGLSLTRLYVRGAIDDSTLRTSGNVSEVSIGSANASNFLVGLDPLSTPTPVYSKFTNHQALLKKFTVRGTDRTDSRFFTGSMIASAHVGRVYLLNTDLTTSGIYTINAASSVAYVKNTERGASKSTDSWTWPSRTTPTAPEIIHVVAPQTDEGGDSGDDSIVGRALKVWLEVGPVGANGRFTVNIYGYIVHPNGNDSFAEMAVTVSTPGTNGLAVPVANASGSVQTTFGTGLSTYPFKISARAEDVDSDGDNDASEMMIAPLEPQPGIGLTPILLGTETWQKVGDGPVTLSVSAAPTSMVWDAVSGQRVVYDTFVNIGATVA